MTGLDGTPSEVLGTTQAFWSSSKYTACRLDLLVGLTRSFELSMSLSSSSLCLVFPCIDIAGGPF